MSIRTRSILEADQDHSFKTFTEILWIHEIYTHISDDGKYRKYKLSFLQRIFLTLEYPTSSLIAEYISIINTAAILLSITAVIISTLPDFQYTPKSCGHPVCDNDPNLCPNEIKCAPLTVNVFNVIDIVCASLFTVDFGIRLLLCGIMPTRLSGTIADDWDEVEKERASSKRQEPCLEPDYPTIKQITIYIFSFHTAVDLLAIIPTFVALSIPNSSTALSLARIFRLVRIFRVLRINQRGRLIVELLKRTMSASEEAIAILLFYLSIVIIFFATIIYLVEHGRYTINNEYPDGEYIRPDGYGSTEVSNFDSIPSTIYFVIITITTIGYGDLYPTTIIGRALTSTCALISIIVLALPITVIGSNFSREYDRYVCKLKLVKTRLKLKKQAVRKVFRPISTFSDVYAAVGSNSWLTNKGKVDSNSSSILLLEPPTNPSIHSSSLQSLNDNTPRLEETYRNLSLDSETVDIKGDSYRLQLSPSSPSSLLPSPSSLFLPREDLPTHTNNHNSIELTSQEQNASSPKSLRVKLFSIENISLIGESFKSGLSSPRFSANNRLNDHSMEPSHRNPSSIRNRFGGLLDSKSIQSFIGSRKAFEIGVIEEEENDDDDDQEKNIVAGATKEEEKERTGGEIGAESLEDQNNNNVPHRIPSHSSLSSMNRNKVPNITVHDMLEIPEELVCDLSHKELVIMFLHMRGAYVKINKDIKNDLQKMLDKLPSRNA